MSYRGKPDTRTFGAAKLARPGSEDFVVGIRLTTPRWLKEKRSKIATMPAIHDERTLLTD
jgi:hypothetical protein